MRISDIKLAVARKKLIFPSEEISEAHSERKVAVIVATGDEKVLQPFLKLKQDLKLDEGQFLLVVCPEKASKKGISEYPSISISDFSWTGKTNSEVSAFLKKKFDILVSFTAAENKIANFLVSEARARLKVGRKIEDEKRHFDLSISAGLSSPEVFTEELKRYLNIINKTA